jgi:hypothetical protein
VNTHESDTAAAGREITLTPLPSQIAAAMCSHESTFMSLIAQETAKLMNATSHFTDAQVAHLGEIAMAGFVDVVEISNREAVLAYIAANTSEILEMYIKTNPAILSVAPARTIQMPDMVTMVKDQLLYLSSTAGIPIEPAELECLSPSEIELFAGNQTAMLLSGRSRHMAICPTCLKKLSDRAAATSVTNGMASLRESDDFCFPLPNPSSRPC